MKPLTIGEVARQAGVGVETVRFYEREGLIADPPRRASGYRQYPRDTVTRIRFIRRAKELGFSLKEIGELLALRVAPGTTCRDIKQRAQAKIADIDERIQTLGEIRNALARLADTCRDQDPVSECPILEALDPGEAEQCPPSN